MYLYLNEFKSPWFVPLGAKQTHFEVKPNILAVAPRVASMLRQAYAGVSQDLWQEITKCSLESILMQTKRKLISSSGGYRVEMSSQVQIH